jgi:hypothetical protein
MVLGHDVGLKEVSSLSILSLVGHFIYWDFLMEDVGRWTKKNWKTFLGYTPETMVLVQG